ncbi:MAG: hypothetical protein IJT94_03145 [Oscillibacter sp.]|nr:hypothetical protein [Oscillibacter sp.]
MKRMQLTAPAIQKFYNDLLDHGQLVPKWDEIVLKQLRLQYLRQHNTTGHSLQTSYQGGRYPSAYWTVSVLRPVR